MVEYYLSVKRRAEHLNGRGKINMKKWLTPSAIQEDLMANAAVAVTSYGSYNATTYCAIPGNDAYHVNDGDDYRQDSNGLWHKDACVKPGTGNISKGTGMEGGWFGSSISNIKIGSKVDDLTAAVDSNIGSYTSSTFEVGGDYKASWESKDWFGRVYKHYGLVHVNSVDGFNPAHPFRS